MRIIIAPAKKMVVDTGSFAADGLPVFLEQTERLKTALQQMSPAKLQARWKCNDAIAKLNVERLSAMELRRRLTPAILGVEVQHHFFPGEVGQGNGIPFCVRQDETRRFRASLQQLVCLQTQ